MPLERRRVALQSHGWLVYLAVGGATAIAYLTSSSNAVKAVLIISLAASAAGAVVLGVHMHRPVAVAPWLVWAFVQAFWAVAWVFWELHILRQGSTPPLSSPAAFSFLGSYVPLAGVLALLLHRASHGSFGSIDTAIIALAVGVVTWSTIIGSYLHDGSLTAGVKSTQILYALADVVVLALVVRVGISLTRRSRALWLLLASPVCLLASDFIWNWSTRLGNYSPGSSADAGWLLFHVSAGAAALHPGMARLFDTRELGVHERMLPKLVLLAAAALLPVAVLSIEPGVASDPARIVPIVVASALIVGLVFVRMAALLRRERRLRSQIAAHNDQLVGLDRLKDSFVASVSHELRTPLTSIRGYLDLVREGEAGELTPTQERFLGIVDRNADRLLRLVGDLLFVAQVDADALSLELCRVDLEELTLEAVQAAGPVAEQHEVDLSLEVRTQLAPISGDPSRISQVLDNLISNALKFTPTGGRVDVRIGSGNGHATVEVADTGSGMTPEEQSRLFDRFYRTPEATEKAIQGTGLGLTIVKAIVDAHGGTIEIDSTPGQGSTFTVSLPLARAEKPSAAAGSDNRSPARSRSAPAAPGRPRSSSAGSRHMS